LKKNILHKIISVWTVVLLLLPIGIQFVHSLENHEHFICTSKEVSHIHEQQIDCSFCHIILETNTVFNSNKPELNLPTNIYITPSHVEKQHVEMPLFFKSSRGPPLFIA